MWPQQRIIRSIHTCLYRTRHLSTFNYVYLLSVHVSRPETGKPTLPSRWQPSAVQRRDKETPLSKSSTFPARESDELYSNGFQENDLNHDVENQSTRYLLVRLPKIRQLDAAISNVCLRFTQWSTAYVQCRVSCPLLSLTSSTAWRQSETNFWVNVLNTVQRRCRSLMSKLTRPARAVTITWLSDPARRSSGN